MSMTEPEFRALLDRYLADEATPAERQLLDQFFELYRDQETGKAVADAEMIREEILNAVRRKNARGIELVSAGRSFAALKIAASIALVAGLSYFAFFRSALSGEKIEQEHRVERVTAKGEKLDVQLPDGTRVKLNSNSRLTYAQASFDSLRDVTLEGEGFFDVVHNTSKPFTVHTGATSTSVLGTTFNVNATNMTALAITLITGKVRVASGGATAVLLPNEQALIKAHSTTIVTRTVDVNKYVAWKNNTLIFEGTRLEEALTTLENWYDVHFDVSHAALKNCVVTGRYQNESLENVLKSFEFMLHIEFSINNRTVTVQGNGCP
jgi:transmembrane sensor